MLKAPKTLKKPVFTPEDDARLGSLVEQYGTEAWIKVSSELNKFTAKQCRRRYAEITNQEATPIKWSFFEDILLVEKFNEIGPRWTKLTTFFKDRTVSEVKYRMKKLQKQGNLEQIEVESFQKVDLALPEKKLETIKTPPVELNNTFEIASNGPAIVDSIFGLSIEKELDQFLSNFDDEIRGDIYTPIWQ